MFEQKVTQKMKMEFVKLYNKGFGTWRIAKQFHLGVTTVRNHLLKSGVKFRLKKKITKEMIEEFVLLYTKGLSIKQIAKKFDVAFSTVQNHLRQNGIKLRPRGKKKDILKTSRELTLEKAYILGVVGPGDGFIEFNKNSQQICLEAVDKDFIDYFAKCLKKVYGIKPSIKTLKRRPTDTKTHFKVRLYSVEACRDLVSYGVSFKEKDWQVPEQIKKSSNEIRGSYLRGIADSQGSVVFGKTSRFIQLSSKNYRGLEEIGNLLNSLDISNWTIYKKARGLRIFSRENFINFAEKINFIIRRKRLLLDDMLRNYKIRKISKKEIIEPIPKILSLNRNGLTRQQIADKLNISRTLVAKNLIKLNQWNSQEQIEFRGIKRE